MSLASPSSLSPKTLTFPSESISYLEQQSPYNTFGGYNHVFAKSQTRWQTDNSYMSEMTFHGDLRYNFFFIDGSVHLEDVNVAWSSNFWNVTRE